MICFRRCFCRDAVRCLGRASAGRFKQAKPRDGNFARTTFLYRPHPNTSLSLHTHIHTRVRKFSVNVHAGKGLSSFEGGKQQPNRGGRRRWLIVIVGIARPPPPGRWSQLPAGARSDSLVFTEREEETQIKENTVLKTRPARLASARAYVWECFEGRSATLQRTTQPTDSTDQSSSRQSHRESVVV